jgi:hypothetical protein
VVVILEERSEYLSFWKNDQGICHSEGALATEESQKRRFQGSGVQKKRYKVSEQRDSSSAGNFVPTEKRYFWPPQNDIGWGVVILRERLGKCHSEGAAGVLSF